LVLDFWLWNPVGFGSGNTSIPHGFHSIPFPFHYPLHFHYFRFAGHTRSGFCLVCFRLELCITIFIYAPFIVMLFGANRVLGSYFGVKDFAGGTVVHMSSGCCSCRVIVLE